MRIGLCLLLAMTSLVTASKAEIGVKPEFVPLFNGVDLEGWRIPDGAVGHWTVKDSIIHHDGKAEPKGDKNIWTETSYGDFILNLEWRTVREPDMREIPVVLPDGSYAVDENGMQKKVSVPFAVDSGIYLRGSSKSQVNIWQWPIGSGEVYGYRTDKGMSPEVREGVTPKVCADNPLGEWNEFVILMAGDRLTVHLNGKIVLENAQLPGVPDEGPIALQYHGDPIEFRNLYIFEFQK